MCFVFPLYFLQSRPGGRPKLEMGDRMVWEVWLQVLFFMFFKFLCVVASNIVSLYFTKQKQWLCRKTTVVLVFSVVSNAWLSETLVLLLVFFSFQNGLSTTLSLLRFVSFCYARLPETQDLLGFALVCCVCRPSLSKYGCPSLI